MATKFNPLQIINHTNKNLTGLVIFFHGSGDTGLGVKEWVKILLKDDLKFPHLKLIYPTAPTRPYTPFNGAPSTVWFDRLGINPDVREHKESLDKICKDMADFIKNEISDGIPLNRIIIGGFSMGGCLALHLAYRFLPEVAGVFALSSFLNKNSCVYEELNTLKDDDHRKQIPLFMCHGDRDDLVLMKWGEGTFENLIKYGVKAEFHSLKDTFHELTKGEMKRLNEWIMKVLPPVPNDKF